MARRLGKARVTLVFVMALAAFAWTGCANATQANGSPSQVGQALAVSITPAYVFTVVLPDGKSRGLTRADLTALPMASIVMDGIPQEGPTLLDVLRFVGVTQFKQVIITGVQDNKPGKPAHSPGSLTLSRDQVTPQTVLDFAANRPTMKVASPTIPKTDWVQDIKTIEVR